MNIPNLPIDAFVDKEGHLTDKAKLFFQQLLTQMQNNLGNEGFVAPTQSNLTPDFNINTIQNNMNGQGQYTCSGGTLIYNSTTNQLMVAILSGATPTFKTITVT